MGIDDVLSLFLLLPDFHHQFCHVLKVASSLPHDQTFSLGRVPLLSIFFVFYIFVKGNENVYLHSHSPSAFCGWVAILISGESREKGDS